MAREPFTVRRQVFIWAGALALALAFLAIDTGDRLRTIAAVSTLSIGNAAPPARDPASSTGFEHRQHRLILPAAGTDGYHWLMQTEQTLAGEGLRIRRTDVDNAPDGREVHWSSPLRWWLAAAAHVQGTVRTGVTPQHALERVAAVASPILLALLLIIATPWVAGSFGVVAAAAFALAWVAVFPLYEMFAAGIIDHHGMVAISCALGLLILASAGAGRVSTAGGAMNTLTPTAAVARRRFIVAGIIMGAGLWVSAATMVPVLVATGVGAVAAAAAAHRARTPAGTRPAPHLWRLWALSGAATSIVAWLVEYFPSHMALRLEVNHPLYAFAWLAGGDLVARLCRRVSHDGALRRDIPWLVADLVVLGAVPVLILATGDTAFRLADPFLRTLHQQYITEFQGLLTHLAGAAPLHVLQSVSLLPLAVAAALVLVVQAVRRSSPAASRASGAAAGSGAAGGAGAAALALLAVPAVALLLLTLLQVRWLGVASAASLALLTAAAAVLWPATSATPDPASDEREDRAAVRWHRARVAGAVVVALVLLPFPLLTALFPWRHGYSAAADAPQLVARDIAWQLRGRLGAAPGAVLSTPTTTTWIAWFGGLRGVGTLYWENVEGLKRAEALLSESDPEEVRRLLDAHGVTHIVLPSWEPMFSARSHPEEGYIPTLPFADSLPAWLVPLPLVHREIPALANLAAHIYEVRAGAGAREPM